MFHYKSKEVCYLINKLKKKNRIVELITNGLLVDNKNIETLLTLDKLSISLDVVSDIDFYSFKINGASKILDGYTKCIENIKKISILRRVLNSKTSIYVTFIATSQNFDFEKWKNTFIELKKIGVNHIQVRSDLNNSLGNVNDIKEKIEEIAKSLNANKIDYTSYTTIDSFNVKYHSPEINETNFNECVSLKFWPSIGSDLKLYRCAHTTLSVYSPFLDILKEDFYDFYLKNFNLNQSVSKIGCRKKCPPTLSRCNYQISIK